MNSLFLRPLSFFLFLAAISSAPAQPASDVPFSKPLPVWNQAVLQAIREMPAKGIYKTDAAAVKGLVDSIRLRNGNLEIDPAGARPSFCSTATYLVFLQAIAQYLKTHSPDLSPQILESFLVRRQPDGVGVWGCWNANGPGTARLFYLLGIGRNFTRLEHALPGDFLKVFWTEEIGSKERGHSVVFLGHEHDPSGKEFILYWSSNQPDGYGTARIPRGRIKRMLFSRLENPGGIANGKSVNLKDSYLAEMLNRPSMESEMWENTGVGL